jgi:divalent metal cation (Fe/Co/Zn/Cd) transporter
MKKIGIVIFAIGVLITAVTGFTYFTREKVVDLGSVEIMANKQHNMNWSPVVGLVVMAVGGAVYLFGEKK